MALSPNPIDLVTVADVEDWIPSAGQESAPPSEVFQRLITGVSRFIVRYTGAGIDKNSMSPTYGASSLSSQINFTEILNGNGSNVLFLNNRPIKTINSLLVNGYAPPINVGYGIQGVAIHTPYSVAFQGGFGTSGPTTTVGWLSSAPSGTFPMGTNNIQIGYLAGFGVANPALDFTLSAAALVSDTGTTTYTGTITDGDGDTYLGETFTVTGFTNPGNNGTFQCIGSTNETLVLINANGLAETAAATATTAASFSAPEDLQVAALEIIQLAYMRRDRSGLDAENIQGTASTQYSKFEMPPDAAMVIRTYTRVPLGAQS